jgi:hypothetical protein
MKPHDLRKVSVELCDREKTGKTTTQRDATSPWTLQFYSFFHPTASHPKSPKHQIIALAVKAKDRYTLARYFFAPSKNQESYTET